MLNMNPAIFLLVHMTRGLVFEVKNFNFAPQPEVLWVGRTREERREKERERATSS